jgi:hypothetical protein
MTCEVNRRMHDLGAPKVGDRGNILTVNLSHKTVAYVEAKR